MTLQLPVPDLLAALVGGGGVVLGLAVGVLLWRRPGPHPVAQRLLAGFLIAGGLTLLDELATALQLYRLSEHFWITPFLYTFALGPLLYLFVRTRTGEPLRRRDAWHALVPTYQIVHELATGLAPLSVKSEFWQTPYARAYSSVDAWVFVVSFGIYLVAALRRLRTPAARQLDDHAWLHRLITGCLAILGVALALELLGLAELDPRDGGAIDWAELGGIVAYASLLYWTAATAIARTLVRPRPARRETYGLDADAVARHTDALRALVAAERPHLDPALTLGALGARLGLSDKELSYVLNAGLGTSYADYVNGLRVEEARQRLAADAEAPVLAVGLASGFGSKATFNRAFKRIVGTTPTQYRAQARLKPS